MFPIKTSIFYFNDYHGNDSAMGSLKTASDYFSKTRNSSQFDTFKITAGDMIKGSNNELNSMWVEFLNNMGLDVSALGNHELDQGLQNLNNNLLKANYKYVSSNIEVNPFGPLSQSVNQAKLVKSMVINKNGNLYGILGLTPADPKYRKPGSMLNNSDIKSKDFSATLTELQNDVNKLRQSGINKIILVSHFDDQSNVIPKTVTGIDVIVSGHKHRVHKGLVPDKNLFYSPDREPVIKVEGGQDGKYMGMLDLAFDPYGRIISADNNLMETEKIPADFSVIGLKQKFNIFKNPVGILKEPARPDLFPEIPLGSFIADATKAKSGADIAIVAPGNISAGLEKGILTEHDIRKVQPYKNKVVKVSMTEKDITQALASSPEPLQVSGIKYTITPDNKVKNVYFEPTKDEKTYTVAIDEFLLKNIKANYKIMEKFTWNQADATIEQIKNKHFMPFDIKPDGRIKVENL
ncbi:MAG: hypothetical protein A2Y25_05905 [Candidatus Melainabacteria bacterium GWF2_37_15]|nr:MAG: hypothetical protein A2Y25_05905 [Candidatus Melainabacteria bacterium GWF2_37_15]